MAFLFWRISAGWRLQSVLTYSGHNNGITEIKQVTKQAFLKHVQAPEIGRQSPSSRSPLHWESMQPARWRWPSSAVTPCCCRVGYSSWAAVGHTVFRAVCRSGHPVHAHTARHDWSRAEFPSVQLSSEWYLLAPKSPIFCVPSRLSEVSPVLLLKPLIHLFT